MAATIDYLIGIDGGGSGTRAALQRSSGGHVLAIGRAGPSALGQGIPQAWRHIEQAVRDAFQLAGIDFPGWSRCAATTALSGVGNRAWKQAFLAAQPGLARLDVESDALAMLVGAHQGKPGVIVVAGTGSIAEVLRPDGTCVAVGGWGFPIGDEGSGAWIGLQAVRHAQAALDGRATAGPLARRIWAHCGEDREDLQAWCGAAGQFAYGQLAPAVFDSEAADPAAAAILRHAASAIEQLALAADPDGHLPLAISGSIGERLAPRLPAAVRQRLVPVHESAALGALRLIRHALHEELEQPA